MADEEQNPESEEAAEVSGSDSSAKAGGTEDQQTDNAASAEAAATTARPVFSDAFDQHGPDEEDYDELPDDEPLTPELVEEEAIRGDFMLRWAGILLAILMAFTQLSDTRPLVLIKSGEHMWSNGFLPPRTDPLSLTMQDQSVSNVSWLFDHVVSLSWKLGGPLGLTALKVMLAAATTWLLSRISIPGLPTWWSSICVGFAVVACSQDFFPTPELITLPAMALTMVLLTRHRLGNSTGLHWKLPALIAVWCNLDSKAWVGVFVIALYAIGSGINRRGLLRLGVDDDRTPSPLGATAALCFAALLVNPFPVASIASPLTTYTREYSGMRVQKKLDVLQASTVYDNRVDYYSILDPGAIWLFDHTHIAAIALLLLSLLALALSLGSEQSESGSTGTGKTLMRGIARGLQVLTSVKSGRPARDAAYLLPLLGMIFLVILASHELPAAAIVACAAGGIAAQEWYRRSFSQSYTVNSSELLFSRGGRALTVLSMAVLGFAVVTSRLPGAAPLGIGFDPETRITVETLTRQIEKLPEEARILHTRLDQGDLLIWSGRKSFVDSRVVPFTSATRPILQAHDNVRRALTNRDLPPTSSDPKVKEQFEKEQQRKQLEARETLEEFQISHMMVRLAPPGNPDYVSMLALNASGMFVPVSIEASAAVLERLNPQESPDSIVERIPRFPEMAFRDVEPLDLGIRQFAVPRGFYDRYIYRTRPVTTEQRRLAQHYMALANNAPERLEDAMSGIALLTMAIRNLNLNLQENPDEVESYVMLGQSYYRLIGLEQFVNGGEISARLRQTRYFQSVAAFRQAAKADPLDIRAWEGLMNAYESMNRQDLMLDSLDQWLDLSESHTVALSQREQFEAFRTRMYARRREIEDMLAESEGPLQQQIDAQLEQAEQAFAQNSDGMAVDPELVDQQAARGAILSAMIYNSAGLPKRALASLRESEGTVRNDPLGTVMLGQLLLETGELEDAHQLLLGISQQALKQPEAFLGTEWQLPVAISQLGVCDYTLAAETWAGQMEMIEQQVNQPTALLSALYSQPLMSDANFQMNAPLPVWPFNHLQILSSLVSDTNESAADLALMQAIVHLEQAKLQEAQNILQRICVEFGETQSRRLALIYFSMVNPNAADVMEPLNVSPWEEFEYPDEPRPPAPPPGAVNSAGGLPAADPTSPPAGLLPQ